MQAVREAPRSCKVTELRSFLGLVNYYNRFLPNLSTKLTPLYALLQKHTTWKWSTKCQEEFEEVKALITSEQVLTHFNPELPLSLACDASPYGLGAVLSHTISKGVERPIAFASRTLTATEQKYAQIDKEGTALIWGIKHFHQYIYGKRFTLITDHQPLTAIFNPEKGVSTTTAARLQRYGVFLSGYCFNIVYRNTTLHGNADALSRLPTNSQDLGSNKEEEVKLLAIQQIEPLPATAEDIRTNTQRDPTLAKVYQFVLQGWPLETGKDLKPYMDRKDELTIEQDCLMWGMRVIVPKKLQEKVLEELHGGHIGVIKMKSLARCHIWWPGIDKDIEEITRSCEGCLLMKRNPKLTPLHPWEFPEGPWRRIHIDFAGPFENRMF